MAVKMRVEARQAMNSVSLLLHYFAKCIVPLFQFAKPTKKGSMGVLSPRMASLEWIGALLSELRYVVKS